VTVGESDWLALRFEENRTYLRAVAYQMLGSLSDADDAVQEAWPRLSRSDPTNIGNLGGWLTTVTARVCLDMLRSRRLRREEPLGVYVPDPIVSRKDGMDPEHDALQADSVGLAPRESSLLPRMDSRFPSWASRSGAGRSSKSTYSPTRRASAGWIWPSSTTDGRTSERRSSA
jgi:DNA-directed RNA polymerase specialized sigma24 family protein